MNCGNCRRHRGSDVAAKHLVVAFQQLGFPLRDLVGVHVMAACQLREGQVTLEGGQGHLGLEDGQVVTAWSSAHVLPPLAGAYDAQEEQRFHLAGCSDFWGHFWVNTHMA